MQKALSIKNDIKELNRMNLFLEEVGKDFHLESSFLVKLNLVLEEAVSNIIFYAYKPGEVDRPIDIILSYTDLLAVKLVDKGKPFDPTKRANPDITLSLEERPIGGLGIFLIKQIIDEDSYKRENGQNILIMKNRIKV